MRHALAFVLVTAVTSSAFAQAARKPPVKKAAPAPAAAATKKVTPELSCPAPLGLGVRSKLPFCEIIAGRDPATGMVIQIPPHKGPATLTFDLHNLHTYSEEQVKAHRAYARYTATIGALTLDNTLITRAVVQNEFRTAADLVDRVGGGAGPGGVKAVAPTGREPITVIVPEGELAVSLLGEKLAVERIEGPATYAQAGRPIAVVSNVMLEYRPGPPPKAVKKK
jgi:hypothetical protein